MPFSLSSLSLSDAAFKQANKGDAPRRGPSAFDMVGKMKHRAWGALRGKSAAEARAVYVQTMDEVAPKWFVDDDDGTRLFRWLWEEC